MYAIHTFPAVDISVFCTTRTSRSDWKNRFTQNQNPDSAITGDQNYSTSPKVAHFQKKVSGSGTREPDNQRHDYLLATEIFEDDARQNSEAFLDPAIRSRKSNTSFAA